jgi:hypothetical protein
MKNVVFWDIKIQFVPHSKRCIIWKDFCRISEEHELMEEGVMSQWTTLRMEVGSPSEQCAVLCHAVQGCIIEDGLFGVCK